MTSSLTFCNVCDWHGHVTAPSGMLIFPITKHRDRERERPEVSQTLIYSNMFFTGLQLGVLLFSILLACNVNGEEWRQTMIAQILHGEHPYAPIRPVRRTDVAQWWAALHYYTAWIYRTLVIYLCIGALNFGRYIVAMARAGEISSIWRRQKMWRRTQNFSSPFLPLLRASHFFCLSLFPLCGT